MHIYFLLMITCICTSCALSSKHDTPVQHEEKSPYTYILSDAEWRKQLSPMEYAVLREAGTERPFTGDLLENKRQGVYTCAGCGQGLFESDTKFDSGTGWPSFFDIIDRDSVRLDTDMKIGYPRSEVLCSRCGGHLGHVFEDGPEPTGLRYCINSVALDFRETN